MIVADFRYVRKTYKRRYRPQYAEHSAPFRVLFSSYIIGYAQHIGNDSHRRNIRRACRWCRRNSSHKYMCADTDGGDGTGADDGSRMLCCSIHPYGAAKAQGCTHQCHPGMDIRHNGNFLLCLARRASGLPWLCQNC